MRLKQQELGEIMGITQPQVSAIMQGKKPLLEVHEIRLKAKLGNKIDKYTTDQPISQGGEDVTLPKAETNNLDTMERMKFFEALERRDREVSRLITIIEKMQGITQGAESAAQKKEA